MKLISEQTHFLLKPLTPVSVCINIRGWQKDYRHDKTRGSDIYCWFVHNSGKGFIDGHYTDYIVPSLNSFLQTLWAARDTFEEPELLLILSVCKVVKKRVNEKWEKKKEGKTKTYIFSTGVCVHLYFLISVFLLKFYTFLIIFQKEKHQTSLLLNLFGENVHLQC